MTDEVDLDIYTIEKVKNEEGVVENNEVVQRLKKS